MTTLSPNSELVSKLFSRALLIRMVEDAIRLEYPKREMRSPTHFCIGQEATPVGVCQHLTPDDYLYSYYRSHGWYLAKGGNLQKMLNELYGKASGCSHGFGGSMHLIDLDVNFQGTTAVVGAAMPHAVGAAFTSVYRGSPAVAVSAFGDGATEEGIFQESLMFAALRKLPIVFVCENNNLATNTYGKDRQPNVPIYKRAEGFGVQSVQVDGNDAISVAAVAKIAIDRARAGEGPTFIEAITYRMLEHCGPNNDLHLGFRTQKELDVWAARDPILRLEQLVDSATVERLRKEFAPMIDAAILGARQAPFPTSLIPEGFSCQK